MELDNILRALQNAPAGSIVYFSGQDGLAVLPKGTEGQALVMGAALPGWSAAYGFTGLTSLTAGDTLYASGTNALAALAKSTRPGVALRNTGASNIPAWGPVGIVLYSGLSASAAHLGTTAAETAIMPATAEGSATIAVANLLAGAIFDWDAFVTFDGDADGNETLTVNVYFGSQLVGTSGALDVDAAGKIRMSGRVKLMVSSASGSGFYSYQGISGVTPFMSGAAFSSFDCTATKLFTVKLDWGGTTDAADTATVQDANLYMNNYD